MSSPENILARYRSYSYHHILIACDSTQTANKLAKSVDITELQRIRSNQGNSDLKYQGQSIDNPGTKGRNYVVLVDGMVDAEFFINKAEWTTVIVPNEKKEATFSQMDGSIEIYEPFGADFVRRLVELTNTLGCDPTGIVFMIKTIFVGSNDDRHEFQQEMIPNINPFLFSLIQLSSVIDESGSTYQLDVVAVQNGFAKMPHINKIAKGFKFNINKGATLPQTLNSLTSRLNYEYNLYANELGLRVSSGTLVDTTSGKASNQYRPVHYRIDPADYKDATYPAGDNVDVVSEVNPHTVSLQFANDAKIETIIKKVMESSLAVVNEANEDNDDVFIFKINSRVDSTPTEMNIIYELFRYPMILQPAEDAKKKKPVKLTDKQLDNMITFNYIFTGLNTDILEFDIKMNMGMAYFQQASTMSFGYDQDQVKEGTRTSQVSTGNSGHSPLAENQDLPKTILYLGDKLSDPQVRNSRNPVSVAAYDAMLAKHSALENVLVNMKIHGNPQLMSDMLVVSPMDPVGGQIATDFMMNPALVKVNIQMPNNDFSNPDAFKQFWFPGVYNLHSVTSTFENGNFTQDLTMFSIPVSTKSEADGLQGADYPPHEDFGANRLNGDVQSTPDVPDAAEITAAAFAGIPIAGSPDTPQ